MIHITVDLVRRLVEEQFPQWSHLEIKPVHPNGHDNRTFHLGDKMSVRLPSAVSYVSQVEKEHTWLPRLNKALSLPISNPLALGHSSDEYPWAWSIYEWLEGETLSHNNINDINGFAKDLGDFLIELQSVDATYGPLAGAHNFYRGGSLSVYDDETRSAIEHNKDVLDAQLLNEIWELSLASTWDSKPVWVHGDVARGNILVNNGKICAVIDFGILGVGDPACDAAMAWTFFDQSSRVVFKQALHMDADTWNRARGWALWKALITYEGNKRTDQIVTDEALNVIQTIMDDYLFDQNLS